jgi:quinone-modifying oxidoreductase subunit QmoC
MPSPTTEVKPDRFVDEIIAATPGEARLRMCIQCGTCGGSCPSGPDMDHTPRQIFALVRAGLRDRVLKSNTPWYCVSCYYCTVRCPQEIHITDIMYTLKRMAVKARLYDDSTAPDFSKTFINWVENYGRSFELGMMSQHMLKHNPFGAFKMAGMGLGMVSKGRMDFTPKHIKGIDGLKAILAKAKELEEEWEVADEV